MANTLEEVRRALWGKSHYFDTDTMRFFGSRCGSWVSLRAAEGRKFIACVESTAASRWGIPRRYRVLIVDMETGNLARMNGGLSDIMEDDWRSGATARRHLAKLTPALCVELMDGRI